MNQGVKIGFFVAVLWCILKLILFYAGVAHNVYNFTALANNFGLLAAISVGLFLFKRGSQYAQVPFFVDFKQALIAGITYTVVVALFSQVYYAKIDASFITERIEQRMEVVEKMLDSDEELATYKQNNTRDELLSREEIIAKIRTNTEGTLSANVEFVVVLLGFSILSLLYSGLICFIFRKVLLKGIS